MPESTTIREIGLRCGRCEGLMEITFLSSWSPAMTWMGMRGINWGEIIDEQILMNRRPN